MTITDTRSAERTYYPAVRGGPKLSHVLIAVLALQVLALLVGFVLALL